MQKTEVPKEKNIKLSSIDDLYKKCNYKTNKDFLLLHEYKEIGFLKDNK